MYDMNSTVIGLSTMTIFQFLGLVSTCTDVAVAMATYSGETVVIHDPSLQMTVLKSKYERAEDISNQDFHNEWDPAMAVPIDFISQRFSTLMTGNQPVVGSPRVNKESRDNIENHVKLIDAGYTPNNTSKEQLKGLPEITAYIANHCLLTPCSFPAQNVASWNGVVSYGHLWR